MVVHQPINITLEELATEVAHLLEYYCLLGASTDSRVSSVPDARTIRYYTTLGILDRPRMEGRQARYGKRQVLQLLAIKALQAHGAPLSDIQTRLFGLSDSELEALLVSLSQGKKNQKEESVRPTVWQEIVIEPGLKIMVESGWTASDNIAEVAEKIKAVLRAIQAKGSD
jgi:DNA-binding transcriptional MerR regulator